MSDKYRGNRIRKVLNVGDTVYADDDGRPMTVEQIFRTGIITDGKYFSYEDHRKKFWLTHAGWRLTQAEKTKKAAEKRALLNSKRSSAKKDNKTERLHFIRKD